jgi:queuine tRNA-ribosyltransferase subunit QTRTD1
MTNRSHIDLLCMCLHFSFSEHLMYMSVRDPLIDSMGTSNENGVSVVAQQGSVRVSPAQYGALAVALSPDIVASISDEVNSTVASNRARKASQRSVLWSDEMQRAMTAASAATPSSKRPLYFATVQGGADLEQRRISCQEYARRAAQGDAATNGPHAASAAAAAARIDGFVISGLGSGEDVAKRDEIVSHVVGALPSTKPRVLSSSSCLHGSPVEVLRAVAQGVDLFEVEYPHQLTLLGQASVFAIDETDVPEQGHQPDLPVTKLHLRDARYAHDKGPILRGCTCFTCKNHTRAYLHHLLNVHEMTAQILLDLSVFPNSTSHRHRFALFCLFFPLPFSAYLMKSFSYRRAHTLYRALSLSITLDSI